MDSEPKFWKFRNLWVLYNGHTEFLFKNLAWKRTDGLDHQNKCSDGHGLKYRIPGPSVLQKALVNTNLSNGSSIPKYASFSYLKASSFLGILTFASLTHTPKSLRAFKRRSEMFIALCFLGKCVVLKMRVFRLQSRLSNACSLSWNSQMPASSKSQSWSLCTFSLLFLASRI